MDKPRDNPLDRPAIYAPRPPRRNVWPVVACIAAAVAAILALIARGLLPADAPVPEAAAPLANLANPDPGKDKVDQPTSTAVAAADANLIADDGHTMWTSPTSGKPLTWAYLPPGVQMVLALRPAALAAHPEGEKVLASLGPLGEAGIHTIEQQTGTNFRQIDRLLVGWQLAGDTGMLAETIVLYTHDPSPAEPFEAALPAATKIDRNGHAYWKVDDRAYYRPGRTDGPSLVVAPTGAMEDIIDLDGQSPPLRRDVERLLAQTDADRLATLVVAPGVLFGEGRDLFAGELTRLRRPLFWFLGDELSAAALSLHWDKDFFAEVVATSTLDVPVNRAAQQLADRIAQMPDQIEAYTVELNASPYSRRVVARLPAMIRKMATYTHSGFGRDFVVLRCYLPAVAGHNLLMGAELALAEPPGGAANTASSPRRAGTPGVESSISELLKRPISLRMPRDTLEAALGQLAHDLGVEIVIRGSDLQLDGITKNQSLTIDIENQPGEAILVEILHRANPDKSAASSHDVRQKLVYVIGPKSPGGPEVIFVTTRARVAERGEKLPAAFAAE